MKVTLENLEDFNSDVLKNKVTSIEQVLEMGAIRKSLKDEGLSDNFKEITDLNKISFGHFVVLEQILGIEKMEDKAKIKMIAPYLIRPVDESKLDNDKRDIEEAHVQSVMKIPIGTIYGVFNRYMEVRKTYLFKTYNGVIYGTLDEDDDDDDEENEGTDLNSGISAREFHNKKFFWFGLIGTVCNDDIFRRSDAVELMMYEVMPFLAEKRSLGIVENLEAKANRR